MKIGIVGIITVLVATAWCSLLSSVDFTKNVVTPYTYAKSNTAGLSMSFSEVQNLFNSSLFKGYMWNSGAFHRYGNLFYQSYHISKGYKYNCSAALRNGTNTICIFDLAANNSYIPVLQAYTANNTNSFGFDFGWDLENSNFANSAYFNNFAKFCDFFYDDSMNLELLDQGDKMSAILGYNYTITNYLTDIDLITNGYYDLWVNGPGITEDADFSWVDQIQNLYNNYYTTFTFRCVVFNNSSQATIANLLSDYYSKDYLLRRIVDRNGKYIDMSMIDIGISDIRLTSDGGVDGVTNSFAAALWAIDISFEFSILGGYTISFYNPLDSSFHSIFGPPPLFAPSAMYYGLLFVTFAFRDYPDFQIPVVVPASSSSIKIYGLYLFSSYRFVILNKDINSNSTGKVSVKLDFTEGVYCVYLKASSLSSTSGITFGNVSFISNRSDYVGTFASENYFINSQTGVYEIDLGYAQAVVCETLSSKIYYRFPRGKSTHNYQYFLTVSLILLLILLQA